MAKLASTGSTTGVDKLKLPASTGSATGVDKTSYRLRQAQPTVSINSANRVDKLSQRRSPYFEPVEGVYYHAFLKE